MSTKLLLQSSLLPLDAVALGRFLVDTRNPQRRYHDPFQYAQSSTVQQDNDIKEMTEGLKDIQIGLSLTEFLTIFKTKRKAHGFEVQAVRAKTYTLNQWDSVFRSACSLPGTRKWLEEAIEDGKAVYFVVGFRTFVDATATEDAHTAGRIEHSVQLPITTVAEANLYGIQLGGVLDPAVSQGNTEVEKASKSYTVEGEAVFAIQYCKVNFKWFFTKKLERSLLGNTKWRVYVGVRGEEEDETEDNTVEAILEDDWDAPGELVLPIH